MKTRKIINATVIFSLIILTLSLSACRKSNLSPFCWGNNEPAVLFLYKGCPNLPIISLEDGLEAFDPGGLDKLPESFRNISFGDTLNVFVNYRKVDPGICLQYQCEPCQSGKILCIQKR